MFSTMIIEDNFAWSVLTFLVSNQALYQSISRSPLEPQLRAKILEVFLALETCYWVMSEVEDT